MSIQTENKNTDLTKMSFRQMGKQTFGQIKRGLSLSHSISTNIIQPNAMSIPSKFETILHPENRKCGFGSTAYRFTNNEDEIPGPGKQNKPLESFETQSDSQSRRGQTACVSKSKRFDGTNKLQPGPGQYLLINKDYNGSPKNIRAKTVISTAGRDRPLLGAFKNIMSPGPGSQDNVPHAQNIDKYKPGAISSFKSNSIRQEINYDNLRGNVPGPGNYGNIDQKLYMMEKDRNALTSNFKKPSDIKKPVNLYDPHLSVEKQLVPGPGAQNLINKDTKQDSSKPQHLSSMFCLSDLDRFGNPIRNKSIPEQVPGPGSYDINKDQPNKKMVSNQVFVSDTKRKIFQKSNNPGPAFYKSNVPPNKRSFHLNIAGTWI